jgi:hypothetical protein
LLTVATAVFDDNQGLTAAGDAEPLNWVVAFSHTFSVPLIVGSGLTVNDAIAVCTEEQV